jgi:hypothetical protein
MIPAWHVKYVETLAIQGNQEDVNYINNNNYCPQQNQGWNQQQRLNYQGNYQGKPSR